MKLLIERRGSGWGGVVGKWLVDIDHQVAYDLRNIYRHPQDIQIAQKLPDISLLNLLYNCDRSYEGLVAMDQQVDLITLIPDNDSPQIVYSTDWTEVYPLNPALRAKLERLMEYLS